jgi:hypothetical protein
VPTDGVLHAAEPALAREPAYAPEPAYAQEPALVAADGSSRGSLERLAVLFEEIEERRELEARRDRSP